MYFDFIQPHSIVPTLGPTNPFPSEVLLFSSDIINHPLSPTTSDHMSVGVRPQAGAWAAY